MDLKERYARHRAYQNLPEQREKRRIYDHKRQSTPEYKARMRELRNTPEYKEKQKIRNKIQRSTPEYKEYKKRYRKSPEQLLKRRAYEYFRKFGVTMEKYNEMHAQQNGLCPICGRPETFFARGRLFSLAIDHCHSTGKIRGLLCHDCNQALGLFRDNTQSLTNAIEYLNGKIC